MQFKINLPYRNSRMLQFLFPQGILEIERSRKSWRKSETNNIDLLFNGSQNCTYYQVQVHNQMYLYAQIQLLLGFKSILKYYVQDGRTQVQIGNSILCKNSYRNQNNMSLIYFSINII